MPYSPTTWVEGVTKLGPTNLNKIEQGIYDASISSASGTGSIATLSTSAASGTGYFSVSSVVFPTSRGCLLAVGVGLPTCEVMVVSAVSATSITGTFAFTNNHSSDETVIWLPTVACPTSFFGAKGDNTWGSNNGTDDTAALQAGINACCRASIWLEGMRRSYRITSPLILPEARIQNMLFTCDSALFAPVDAVGATLISSQDGPMTFTADASTNLFTTSQNSGIGAVGNMIVFTGSSLPSPLVQGRVYYVETKPSSTTFTISATSGGAQLDITTDGSGTTYPDVAASERCFLTDVTGHGNSIASLNAYLGAVQQPFEWKKVRFDFFLGVNLLMNIAGTQIAYFDNIEFNRPGTVARLTGSGYVFSKVNVVAPSVDGFQLASANHVGFFGLWWENSTTPTGGMIHAISGGNYAITIENCFASTHSASDPVILIDSAAASSYSLRDMRFGSSTQLIVKDDNRAFALSAVEFSQQALNSYEQSDSDFAPIIAPTSYRARTSAYTASISDNGGFVRADATGGGFAVQLPSADNLKGYRLTIKRINSGANAVSASTDGVDSLDGATTYALTAQYKYVTVVSDGGNWHVVANN